MQSRIAESMHVDSSSFSDKQSARRGVEFPEVIDMLGEESSSGDVVLVLEERRAWDGSELRLFQLQEKLNAYLAFALDGELAEAYPGLAGRPVRLRLDAVFPPDLATTQFLEVIRRQVGFQGISVEVRVLGDRVALQRPTAENSDDHMQTL